MSITVQTHQIQAPRVCRINAKIKARTPTEKPRNTKETSECGRYQIYTYWLPWLKKDGSTVYHKHVNKRVITVKDPNKKRKPRKTDETPLTERQKQMQKRKLLNLLKNQILRDPKYTLENTQTLYEKLRAPRAVETLLTERQSTLNINYIKAF